MEKFDAIVIGSGPGGMEAATRLLAGGKKVAIVEKGEWGGVCLNCGCIPTKLLLGAIAPGRLLSALSRRRLASGEINIDYSRLQAHVKKHIASVNAGIGKSLAQAGGALFNGSGALRGDGCVQINSSKENADQIIAGDVIILATGSAPATFPGLAPDHKAILDSTDLMFIDEPPKSLIIIGAGPIGLELADFFSWFGTKIILVEAALQLAPTEDEDIAEELKRSLTRQKCDIHTGIGARSLITVDDKARLELTNGEMIEAEKALLAIGRKPVTAGLNLDAASCEVDKRGFLKVNQYLEAAPGIYAIGDVNGRLLLAHAATHQGAYVASRLLGFLDSAYESGPVPACFYCQPEIMRAGLSAKEAAQKAEKVEISRVMLAANAIAQAHLEPEGFVKAVFGDGKLLGMAAIGYDATSLVTAAELFVAGQYEGLKLDSLMAAHPTLAEALFQAIRAKREVFQKK